MNKVIGVGVAGVGRNAAVEGSPGGNKDVLAPGSGDFLHLGSVLVPVENKVCRLGEALFDSIAVEAGQPLERMMHYDEADDGIFDLTQRPMNLRFADQDKAPVADFARAILVSPAHPRGIKT